MAMTAVITAGVAAGLLRAAPLAAEVAVGFASMLARADWAAGVSNWTAKVLMDSDAPLAWMV